MFGEIADVRWVPNEFGKIVEEEWERTGGQRDNVTLDDFVVMHNHLHGTNRLAGRGTAPCPYRYASHVGDFREVRVPGDGIDAGDRSGIPIGSHPARERTATNTGPSSLATGIQ